MSDSDRNNPHAIFPAEGLNHVWYRYAPLPVITALGSDLYPRLARDRGWDETLAFDHMNALVVINRYFLQIDQEVYHPYKLDDFSQSAGMSRIWYRCAPMPIIEVPGHELWPYLAANSRQRDPQSTLDAMETAAGAGKFLWIGGQLYQTDEPNDFSQNPEMNRLWYRCAPRPIVKVLGSTLWPRLVVDRGFTLEIALEYLGAVAKNGGLLEIGKELYQDREPPITPDD